MRAHFAITAAAATATADRHNAWKQKGGSLGLREEKELDGVLKNYVMRSTKYHAPQRAMRVVKHVSSSDLRRQSSRRELLIFGKGHIWQLWCGIEPYQAYGHAHYPQPRYCSKMSVKFLMMKQSYQANPKRLNKLP